MDLIAFVTDTDELVVNRLAGHRVWLNTPYTPRGAKVTPVALDWRPDGKVLVIAYDNGHLQYVDVNDGSVIEQRLTENVSDEHRALKNLRWSEHDLDLSHACSKPTITCDTRKLLPHLPPLPSSGLDRTFTSHQAVGDLIHSHEQHLSKTQILSLCCTGNHISFLLGYLSLKLPIHGSLARFCVSTSDLSLHILAVDVSGYTTVCIYDLQALGMQNTALHELITIYNETTVIQQYIDESINCIDEEFETVTDARGKTMARLAEACGSFIEARADLHICLMTGSVSAALAEWLSNDIGDRLLKKWEKTSMIGFTNIRKLITESALPAYERIMISLSRLGNLCTTVSTMQLDALAIRGLKLSVRKQMASLHRLLHIIRDELNLFPAFCQWLSYTIARQNQDDEVPDTAMSCSIAEVRQYIDFQWPDGSAKDALSDGAIPPNHEIQDSLLATKPFDHATTPSLRQQLGSFQPKFQELFSQPISSLVAQWHPVQDLSIIADSADIDCRIIDLNGVATVWLLIRTHSGDLYIAHYGVHQNSVAVCRLLLEEHDTADAICHQAIFIDDADSLLLLRKADNTSCIASIRLSELHFDLVSVQERPICHSRLEARIAPIHRIRHLPPEVSPMTLVANGRPGRRTGLYLQNDRQRYTIFDLDDSETQDDDDSSMNESQ